MATGHWNLMELVPKDGTKVDILAKRWNSEHDLFSYKRFVDCYWSTSLGRLEGVKQGYYPIFWMLPPDLPASIVSVG